MLHMKQIINLFTLKLKNQIKLKFRISIVQKVNMRYNERFKTYILMFKLI